MSAHYIRYLAATDESQVGLAALAYLKALMRCAPVRVCSMSGDLVGRWVGYAPLLATPMTGRLVNVVCCDSSRWTWKQMVPAPPKDLRPEVGAGAGVPEAEPMDAPTPSIPVPPEIISGRIELYTAGVRNTLIACASWRNLAELATGRRYEGLIVPSSQLYTEWERAGASPRLIPLPVSDHATLTSVVLP